MPFNLNLNTGQFYQSGGYFNGGPGQSFLSNGYVVYTHGLKDETGHTPHWNPYAVKQGLTYIKRMTDIRSMDERSSFYKFISYLEKIGNQEHEKELKLIETQLQNMEGKWSKDYIDQIRSFLQSDDFSSAYTLMMNQKKDLEEIKTELKSNNHKHAQQMTEFFNSTFPKWLEQHLGDYLEPTMGGKNRSSAKIVGNGVNISVQGLVHQYILDQISQSTLTPGVLKPLEDRLMDGVLAVFKHKGVLPDNATVTTRLFRKGTDYTYLKPKKNKILNGRYKNKKVFNASSTIFKNFDNSLNNIIGNEIETLLASYKNNQFALSTGHIIRPQEHMSGTAAARYQKTDTSGLVFEINESVDTSVVSQMFSESIDTKEAYNELIDDVVNYLEQSNKNSEQQIKDLFIIDYNTKGYLSWNYIGKNSKIQGLSIEQSDSFENNLGRLSRIIENSPNGRNTDFEKLIFLLNNTSDGAIADNKKEEIANYIAAVCVIWLWDDSLEMMKQNPESIIQNGITLNKIHIFQSGSAYFTASDIIRYTVEQLKDSAIQNDSFVNVRIDPAPTYPDYAGLQKKYPLDGITNTSSWQAQLQKRWDEVKEYTTTNSKLGISFKQQQLEKLVAKFESLGG